MATRQIRPIGVPSPLARRLQMAHSALMWLLVAGMAGVVTLLALSLLEAKSDLIGPYYLQLHLVIAVTGLVLAALGVVRLAFDDLGIPVPGMRPNDTSRRLGYFAIVVGFAIGAYGLFSLVGSQEQTGVDIDIFMGVVGLASAAMILYHLLSGWVQGAGGADTDGNTQTPARISRRTVLVGLGVLGLTCAGIGLLIRSLPAILPRFTYRGHSDHLRAVAWSPNGQRIASSDVSGVVQIWNALTGEFVVHVSMPQYGAASLSWAPDNRRIAAGSFDGTVRIVDGTTGQNILTYRGNVPSDTGVSGAVAWSPTGAYVASVEYDGVHIWDAHTGFTHLVIEKGESNVLAWSPDGSRIVVTDVGSPVTIWDARTGKPIIQVPVSLMTIDALAWSPNGKHIVVAGDNGAQIFDASTGEYGTFFFGQHNVINGLAWSPDSRYIVSASYDNTVEIWEASSGRIRFSWRGHFGAVETVAWSPDGTYIASGGWDTTVQVWQPQLG